MSWSTVCSYFSDFKKSIQFSPSPFNPNKKPEQGILKTPDSAPQKTPRVNVSIATPDGMKRVSPQKIVRQATPHIKKVRVVQRTPSSVKKLKTPVSSKKYTGTPVPKKSAPVMSLKTTTRAKAAAFFWNWCRSTFCEKWTICGLLFTYMYVYTWLFILSINSVDAEWNFNNTCNYLCVFIWLNHIANMLLFSTASITYKIDETEGLLFIGFLYSAFLQCGKCCETAHLRKIIKLIGIQVYRLAQEILAFSSWF